MRRRFLGPVCLVAVGVFLGITLAGGDVRSMADHVTRALQPGPRCPELPSDVWCPRTFTDEEVTLARQNLDFAVVGQYWEGTATPPPNHPFFSPFDRDILQRSEGRRRQSWPFEAKSQILLCGAPPQRKPGVVLTDVLADEFAPGNLICESLWGFSPIVFALECQPRSDLAMLCWNVWDDWAGEADTPVTCVWLRWLTPLRGGMSDYTRDRTIRYFAECGPQLVS